MATSTHISPNFTVADWQKLNLANNKEDDWQQAINIFKDRLYGRFLKPVELIEKYIYAGFAIMALDCLLIETLQQFWEGVAETPKTKSGCYFTRFLTRTSFNEWFSEEKANKFYTDFRCGILHQAETKESSKITIKEESPLVEYAPDRNGLIINRKLFHQQLVKEFESYLIKLRNPLEAELRANIKKKMDYICRLP